MHIVNVDTLRAYHRFRSAPEHQTSEFLRLLVMTDETEMFWVDDTLQEQTMIYSKIELKIL